ncbi:nucleoside diphosphate kinase regulator [Zavarzinia compransoris]|uniref:Nucleoside diphosphate kinase regulator n=1 Tax=Zavarzinia compransoris TaxID=1264899 RepID=A0A317EF16_9PROT|nr:nucleoside diphosphate kinase regulator [Zavarzinia compransoris]PWR23973.1 nucleoside diphosphate kinase regulator [Zavarzinia compransoris]TDP48226.1 regulator of nucleoside diphosphate kinase [Zavarzinia compransoris]
MTRTTKPARKPAITVGTGDYNRLSDLAAAIEDRNPVLAAELQAELDRARVVADHKVPAGVVRMGSTVAFDTDDGQHRHLRLVFPAEADIAAGTLSILTPIGAALIGLSAGQSIGWTARDGRHHALTVVSVEPPR